MLPPPSIALLHPPHQHHHDDARVAHTAFDPLTTAASLYAVYNTVQTMSHMVGGFSGVSEAMGTVSAMLAQNTKAPNGPTLKGIGAMSATTTLQQDLKGLVLDAIGQGAAKDAVASSVTSGLMTGAAMLGAKLLFSVYGDDVTTGIVDGVSMELLRFQNMRYGSVEASPPPVPNAHHLRAPPAHLHSEPPKSATSAEWEAWHRAGAATTPKEVRGMDARSVGMMLLVFGGVFNYLHGIGAYEMRRKTRARAEASAAVSATSTTSTTTTTPVLPSRQKGVGGAAAPSTMPSEATRAFYDWQARQTVRVRTEIREQEDGGDNGQDGLLSWAIRQMYANHPFYAPVPEGKADTAWYFTLQNNHPVRFLINLMLGFSLQANALLLGGDLRHTGDPIHITAKMISFWVYWELFARALRLYGWAPVYVATQQLLNLFSSPAPPPRPKTMTTTGAG
jgi:hypothetical protein